LGSLRSTYALPDDAVEDVIQTLVRMVGPSPNDDIIRLLQLFGARDAPADVSGSETEQPAPRNP